MSWDTSEAFLLRIRNIKNNFKTSILIIFLSISLFLLILFNPMEEDISVWFQRSGSILVVFAIYLELWNSKLDSDMNLSGLISLEQNKIRNDYGKYHLIIKYFGLLLAILGTTIWGYGDLIYNNFVVNY